MEKVRHVPDGRIFFYKVTVILKNGKELTAITDTSVSDIDLNWRLYMLKARNKWGGQIDSFQIVQLSKHDPELKQYMKANNIHLPSQSVEEDSPGFGELKLSEHEINEIFKKPTKPKQHPGKYRS